MKKNKMEITKKWQKANNERGKAQKKKKKEWQKKRNGIILKNTKVKERKEQTYHGIKENREWNDDENKRKK